MYVDIRPCDDINILSKDNRYIYIHAFLLTDNTLDKRQQQAIDLRQSTIRAQTMTDQELADLRADIKVETAQWQASN